MISKALIIYLIAINSAGVIINITDKHNAVHKKWRISEKALWTTALLGGAAGSYITMKLIRHKTKHKSFMIFFPIIAIIQIIAVTLYFTKELYI